MFDGESFDDDRSDISENSFDNQENSSDEVHKNGSSDNVTDQDLNEEIEEKEFREDKIESLDSIKHVVRLLFTRSVFNLIKNWPYRKTKLLKERKRLRRFSNCTNVNSINDPLKHYLAKKRLNRKTI